MKTVFIYALNEPCSGPDPTAGRTRYVGKADNPHSRYQDHLDHAATEKTHKANWICSLLAIGKTPILEILDEVPESEWQFWECEWIRLYRALGFRLTNCTEGGDGISGHRHSLSTIEKMSAAALGRRMSVRTRAKLSAVRTGMVTPADTREKIRVSLTGEKNHFFGKKHTPESREKMSISRTGEKHHNFGKNLPLVTRVKMSASQMGKKHSAETRAKISAHRKFSYLKKKALDILNCITDLPPL